MQNRGGVALEDLKVTMRFMDKDKKDQTFKGTINILGHKIVLLKGMKYNMPSRN